MATNRPSSTRRLLITGTKVVLAAVVGALAVAVGVAVAVLLALTFHEVLALGPEDDDTLVMQIPVLICYLAGIAAGLAVVAVGWRRLLRWKA